MNELFKEWAAEFFNGKMIQMDEETSSTYFTLCIVDNQNMVDEINENDESVPFAIRLIKSRCKFIDLKITDPAIIALSLFCKTPGDCVMYIYALKYMQLNTNGNRINMNVLSFRFPYGFYNDDHLLKMWEKQKLPDGGNLLDQDGLW